MADSPRLCGNRTAAGPERARTRPGLAVFRWPGAEEPPNSERRIDSEGALR